jgi:hypothetical protein
MDKNGLEDHLSRKGPDQSMMDGGGISPTTRGEAFQDGSPVETEVENRRGLDRSLLNMVDFYRESLWDLLRGRTSLRSIPLGNRKRFIASGIVRKFGTRYELTEAGLRVLQSVQE